MSWRYHVFVPAFWDHHILVHYSRLFEILRQTLDDPRSSMRDCISSAGIVLAKAEVYRRTRPLQFRVRDLDPKNVQRIATADRPRLRVDTREGPGGTDSDCTDLVRM